MDEEFLELMCADEELLRVSVNFDPTTGNAPVAAEAELITG